MVLFLVNSNFNLFFSLYWIVFLYLSVNVNYCLFLVFLIIGNCWKICIILFLLSWIFINVIVGWFLKGCVFLGFKVCFYFNERIYCVLIFLVLVWFCWYGRFFLLWWLWICIVGCLWEGKGNILIIFCIYSVVLW